MSENRIVPANRIVSASVFCLLIAIGVVGRWFQPDWCFTPLAAVSLFAGFYFARPAAAFLVPLAIMTISDLLLPAYASPEVLLFVYAVALVPVALGRRLRQGRMLPGLAFYAVLPAVSFWLVSNFAVWMFQGMYPATFEGLLACYIAALPFFRSMLSGDLLFTTLVFGCYLLSGDLAWSRLQRVAQRSDRP